MKKPKRMTFDPVATVVILIPTLLSLVMFGICMVDIAHEPFSVLYHVLIPVIILFLATISIIVVPLSEITDKIVFNENTITILHLNKCAMTIDIKDIDSVSVEFQRRRHHIIFNISSEISIGKYAISKNRNSFRINFTKRRLQFIKNWIGEDKVIIIPPEND